jgi:formamidopyrimidine-DNA glycosylase
MVDVSVRHERTARHNGAPEVLEKRLRGRKVDQVGRKGKFLTIPLDDGQTMVAHLGMSGRFVVSDPSDELEAHTHVLLDLDDGVEVRFIDPRTFGFVAVFTEDELADSGVSRLGPDAWTEPPTVEDLEAALQGRTAPIKALLLDQGPISGRGNIYADEALHVARIHPLTPSGEITGERLAALLAATREVLAGAIENGGTSLDDLAYLLPDGRPGENLEELLVYGRDGLPCFSCGNPVEKVVVRARSTHFCPECQT